MAKMYKCDLCGEMIESHGTYGREVFLPNGTRCYITAKVTEIETPEQKEKREERAKYGPMFPSMFREIDICRECLDGVLAAGGFPKATVK